MKKFLHSKNFLLLLAIFIGACLIRMVFLSSLPVGFDRDEVANTYIGRFILQNGRDIYGNSWPLLYFNKFGDYPPVIPMYLSGIATYIFGFTIFAARFPSALFGAITVFPVYALFSLLHSKKTGLVGATLVAILPWHVILSRSSAEGILGLFFCVLGLGFLFSAMQTKQWVLYIASFFSFFLTYFLYPSFRVLVPLILLPIPFLFPLPKKQRIILFSTICLFFILSLSILSTPWGKGRINQTSLLSNPTYAVIVKNHLKELINNENSTPPFITHIFNNKPLAYFQWFTKQYFDYFSPQFLFLKGGLPARYAVPNLGLVYLTLVICGAIALIFPQQKEKKQPLFFMIYLLLLAPLPAFVTVDDSPNIHRSIFLILPLLFLFSLAVIHVYKLFIRTKHVAIKGLLLFLVCLFVIESIFDGHQYFAHAGKINGIQRNDGALQLAEYITSHQKEYPAIAVQSLRWEPLYYLFLHKDVSAAYIGKIKLDFRIAQIGNIHFIPEECLPVDQMTSRYFPVQKPDLIIYGGDCAIDPSFRLIGEIPRQDGTIAYRLLLQK